MHYAMYPDGREAPSCPDIMSLLENIFNMLVIVSSSTNFIIYFALRRRFRETLRRRLLIVCCARCRPEEVSRLRRSSTEESFDMRHRSASRAGSNDSGARVSTIECSNKSMLLTYQVSSSVKRKQTGDTRGVEMKHPVKWWSSCLAGYHEELSERRPEHINGVYVAASNGDGRRNGTATSRDRSQSNDNNVELCALNGTAKGDQAASHRNGNSGKARRSVDFHLSEFS